MTKMVMNIVFDRNETNLHVVYTEYKTDQQVRVAEVHRVVVITARNWHQQTFISPLHHCKTPPAHHQHQ